MTPRHRLAPHRPRASPATPIASRSRSNGSAPSGSTTESSTSRSTRSGIQRRVDHRHLGPVGDSVEGQLPHARRDPYGLDVARRLLGVVRLKAAGPRPGRAFARGGAGIPPSRACPAGTRAQRIGAEHAGAALVEDQQVARGERRIHLAKEVDDERDRRLSRPPRQRHDGVARPRRACASGRAPGSRPAGCCPARGRPGRAARSRGRSRPPARRGERRAPDASARQRTRAQQRQRSRRRTARGANPGRASP